MSSSFVSTLRPGYLVACTTSIKGNVTYNKQDLDFLKLEDGASKTRWETERLVKDAEEQERATEIVSKSRSLISSVCSKTDFGYLCPVSRKADLDAAADKARDLCREFNATSKFTRVKLSFFTGYVADNDAEAVTRINSEVRDLLEEMKVGLENLDVERVREAASKASQLGQMLAPEAEIRIQLAVKEVRDNAKQIAKAVKAGEQASIVIERAALNRIAEARTAFLDIDLEDREVIQPGATARAIDLAPDEDAPVGSIAAPARAMEVG